MQVFLLILACLVGGWWLFSGLLGGGENATDAVKRNPERSLAGVLFFAVLVFAFLVVIGLLSGR